MGRLQALIGASCAAALLTGCPEQAPTPPARSRVDMVVRDPAQPPVVPDAGHANPAPAVTARTGPLCDTTATDERIEAPPSRAVKAQGAESAGAIAPGAGRWTWINLWAAWCVPCREEMPLLRRWQTRLATDGVSVDLAFLSLDDDERQLQQLLDRAQEGLPRASAWLPGSTARTRWLATVGLRDSPALPVQLLIDPEGKLACTIRGALEEGDYPDLRSFLQRTR